MRLLLTTAVCLTLLASCKKSSISDNINGSGSLSSTINGIPFQSTTGGGFDSEHAMFISAMQIKVGDSTQIGLNLCDTSINVGSPMPFSPSIGNGYPNLDFVYYNRPATYIQMANSGGSVTITAWDSVRHSISGSFTQTTVYNGSNPDDSLVIGPGKFQFTYVAE